MTSPSPRLPPPGALARLLGLRIDPFLAAIVAAATLGALLPASGAIAAIIAAISKAAIAVMFFLQGVKLSRGAVLAGLGHWRLHLLILACTFIGFPLIGLGLRAAASPLLPPLLWTGLVFLCLLPSTVQSSIAYVALARGNVAAAVCAATASNLLGILVTPAAAALVLHTEGQALQWGQIGKIALQVLAPFLLGQIAQPWLSGWAGRHKPLTTLSDRGAIVLIVYLAFSAATLLGVWRSLRPADILALIAVVTVLLGVMLAVGVLAARALGFARADEVAILFCGSQKSLATGAPMAAVLFPAASLGAVIVPLVLFHQLQLMAAAAVAARYAEQPEADDAPVAG